VNLPTEVRSQLEETTEKTELWWICHSQMLHRKACCLGQMLAAVMMLITASPVKSVNLEVHDLLSYIYVH